jgi:gas vesicle protein
MRIVWGIGCVAALFLIAPRAAAQSGDRLTDKDVKRLIDSVDQARDRFEDQLDGKVKNGIVRSATGEVNVREMLEDFQQELDKLKSRYTEQYAASAEAETVLRRGAALHAFMKTQPAGLKGANEWDRLASELRRLAAVYRTDFPLPEGAAVRRINDAEAAASVKAISGQAEQIKRAVDADKTMPKAEKQALKQAVEDLVKQAKTLQSRLSDSKPATADARALMQSISALTTGGRQLPPAVLTGIGGMRAPLEKLNQAFGMKPPATE